MRDNSGDPRTSDDLPFLGLVDIGRRIASSRVSSVEVTRAILDRISRLDGQLKSYATLTPELALEAAERADREIASGQSRGPLHGVPIGVKDLCRTKGVVTSAGMPIYKDYVPEDDATVVTRLKDAGAVLLGKLQMTEGAFSVHHPSIEPPVNPWSREHWAGVSSSGSGVATAAGLCYGAIGTDTLGSIRFPSTMNGITGLKPTWGRVSRAGVFALAESLDHVGVMTRSAVDAAAMLQAIAGVDRQDPTALRAPVPDYLKNLERDIREVRVGIDRDLIASNAEQPMAAVVDEAAGVLDSLGAEVRLVTFPSPERVVGDAMKLCAAEAAVAHKDTYPERSDEYGPVLAGLIETGLKLDVRELAQIWQRRLEFRGGMAALFDEIDILLMPAMDSAAPTIAWLKEKVMDPEARYKRLLFTTPFTMSGNPCLVLPGGATAEGMPLGFQIIGRHLDEELILQVGHAYQRETDWHLRRPGLFT